VDHTHLEGAFVTVCAIFGLPFSIQDLPEDALSRKQPEALNMESVFLKNFCRSA